MAMTKKQKAILLQRCCDITIEECKLVAKIPIAEKTRFQLENGFKEFKAKESGEVFDIIAIDMKDAKDQADLWDAELLS